MTLFLLLFLLYLPFSSRIDLLVSGAFYRHERFSTDSIWQGIYTFGIYPGWILFFVGVALLVFKRTRITPNIRATALLIILTFVVGPALLIHGILKEQWGRPRPRQIVEFGGTEQYRPFYVPELSVLRPRGKSFPSGHAAMGFCFFALIPVGRLLKRPWLSKLGLFLALILGGALGLARIAQGGHFFSDIVGSAVLMWGTVLFLDRKLLQQTEP